MAQLVLGVAGAAVGSFFGSPQIGWMVGVTLGGVLGQKKTHTEGPRLTDLSVQSSTYGGMVPILYGSMRVAGNVIFCTDKREVSTTTRNSGKGGASSSSTTYSYNVDMAVGLCANQIAGIRKIWVNGKLKLDASATASIETQIASTINAAGVTVYYGTESQMPDATMEATLGVGNVPAYRGTAYIMFTALDCPGGVIPQLTFEVCTGGTDGGALVAKSLMNATPGAASIAPGDTSGTSALVSVADVDGKGLVWRLYSEDGAYISVGGGVLDIDKFGSVYGSSFSCASTSAAALSGIDGDFTIVYRHRTNGISAYDGSSMVVAMSVAEGEFPTVAGQWLIKNQYATSPAGRVISFSLKNSDGATVGMTGAIRIPIGPEYEVKVVRAGGTLYLYIDGVLDATSTAGVITPLSSDPALYLSIGAWGQTGPGFPNIYAGGLYSMAWVCAGSGFVVGADPTVGSVISDICQRAGLAAGSIDVTGLTETLRGYALTNVSSARANLEPLLKAFFIDVVESDGKLKFRKRSGITSSASIPLADLGASENDTGDADVMPLRRTQEAEMPRSVSVSFINQDSDYQPGTEVSRRIVTESINDVTTDLPMAVDAVRAATVADALLFDAWTERNKRSFKVSRKYAALDAGDVVSIEHPAGTWTAKRITRAVDAGAVIECDAVDSDASVYTVVPVGATPAIPQAGISYFTPANGEALDIPILQDADDNAGIYFSLGGIESDWPGGQLYVGPDEGALAYRGGVQSSATFGVCMSTLGTWANLLVDELNSLRVRLSGGALFSATHEAILSGAVNLALVGSELVQFKNATLGSDGVYTLSGFLRGVRGTEAFRDGHVVNEKFTLIEAATIVRAVFDLSELNQARKSCAVTTGASIATSYIKDFQNTGVGLMPFAPVNLRRTTAANDITLTWDRRTRSSSTFPAGGLDVPLLEASESYSVAVYSSSGFTTVVRTLTSTTPTVTYTSAQQTADGLTPGAVVNVRVVQVGRVVSRNYLQGTL